MVGTRQQSAAAKNEHLGCRQHWRCIQGLHMKQVNYVGLYEQDELIPPIRWEDWCERSWATGDVAFRCSL